MFTVSGDGLQMVGEEKPRKLSALSLQLTFLGGSVMRGIPSTVHSRRPIFAFKDARYWVASLGSGASVFDS